MSGKLLHGAEEISSYSPVKVDEAHNEQLIRRAIDQNKTLFLFPNLSSPPMHGKMLRNGLLVDCISIHLKDANKQGYPVMVTVDAADSIPQIVYIDYITGVNTARVHSSTHAGGPIANSSSPGYKGTICCRLQKADGTFYLLTCSHVMNNGSGYNYAGTVDPPQPAIPFGSWVWALRTSDMDAALIQIDPTDQFTYPDNRLQGKPPRQLTANDMLTTDIFMAGRNIFNDELNLVSGKITNISSVFPVDVYYNSIAEAISNLIILSSITVNGDTTTYNTMSVEGDSGALVYDLNFNPIGMVIAGDNQFTYAIPLDSILLNTQTTIA